MAYLVGSVAVLILAVILAVGVAGTSGVSSSRLWVVSSGLIGLTVVLAASVSIPANLANLTPRFSRSSSSACSGNGHVDSAFNGGSANPGVTAASGDPVRRCGH
jgi:hypothetical protein